MGRKLVETGYGMDWVDDDEATDWITDKAGRGGWGGTFSNAGASTPDEMVRHLANDANLRRNGLLEYPKAKLNDKDPEFGFANE